jgi:hypothetical protein
MIHYTLGKRDPAGARFGPRNGAVSALMGALPLRHMRVLA